jgi:serine protease DegQ
MKRMWLLFAQAVTLGVAFYFVLVTFHPEFGVRRSAPAGSPPVSVEQPRSGITSAGPLVSFRAPAEKASAAVVSISTRSAPARHPYANHPLFRYYFGDQGGTPQTGLGSGVIVSADGTILTNNHVIEGAAEIEVQLGDSRQVRAKVIGADPETDLAVLKINMDRLPVLGFGNADALKVGDPVLAIGNPFGVGQTVTSGIVSALGRSQLGINTFENFIQTDAAINPGNSGGALVDIHGDLVGINTAIYSRSGGNMGIGFAIPASTARQVLDGILKDGVVTRGWIGVQPMDLQPQMAQTIGITATSGVLIAGVLENGPAAQGGLKPGDVVREVAGKKVDNVSALLTAVASLKPGDPAKLVVQRRDATVELTVTPAKRPSPGR